MVVVFWFNYIYMPFIIKGEFIGNRYERLEIIDQNYGKRGGITVKLRCDCGNIITMPYYAFLAKRSKSCGCLNLEKIRQRNTSHNQTNSSTYKSWAAMKWRCSSKNKVNRKNYFDRGIGVCQEWLGSHGYINFVSDMGDRPNGMTLDRIDNNLGYNKSNCRWATRIEQNSNTRQNVYLTFEGVTDTVAGWSRRIDIPEKKLRDRIQKLHWDAKRALTS